MDEIEHNLYAKMIDSEYEYFEYLRKIKLKSFDEETKEYVWDKQHTYYKYMFPDGTIGVTENKNDYECSKKSENNQLYKKLSLICHPDKCPENWSLKMFVIVNDANINNDTKLLEEIQSYWEKYKSFDKYDNKTSNKKKQIDKWKLEFWYLWSLNDPILKEIFVNPIEYEKRLIFENICLTKKYEEQEELNKKLKKIVDDLNTSQKI